MADCLNAVEAMAEFNLKALAIMRFSTCDNKKCASCLYREKCFEVFKTISAYEALQIPDKMLIFQRVLENTLKEVEQIQKNGTKQYFNSHATSKSITQEYKHG